MLLDEKDEGEKEEKEKEHGPVYVDGRSSVGGDESDSGRNRGESCWSVMSFKMF